MTPETAIFATPPVPDDAATRQGRVLLHVGTHRTGTTAFQRWLVEWRDDLLREHDILVHQGCFLPSHLELPALVIRDGLLTPDRWLLETRFQSDPDTMRRAIRATVDSDAATVLFSAEGLSYMRAPGEVERLRDLMAPRAITPIVVLRDPASFLASFRSGLQRWFSGPVTDRRAVAYTEPGSWLVDYAALLATLRDLTGTDGPIVIDYDRETESSGSIIPALAEAMGLPRAGLYPNWDRRDNVTPDAGRQGAPTYTATGPVARPMQEEEQPPPKALALSVVVVVHDMAREAARTLLSLSAGYQREIAADAYEVIVIDNGSDPPLDPEVVSALPGTFRLLRIDPAPPSPAQAANRGLAAARGDVIGLLVDGARLVTPGLLHYACHGAQLHRQAVVATLGWHLGLDSIQSYAMEGGYDTAREDALLARIDWPADGYRLFEVGAVDGPSIDGWFSPILESNALFLRREMWDALGGVDERFDMPGGGFLNLDLLRRALELPQAELVILLGEGTFHQLHGGISTNVTYEERTASVSTWRAQYEVIRGRPWSPPSPRSRTYVGSLPRPMLQHLLRSAITPVSGRGPLGPDFDPSTWSLRPQVLPEAPRVAALVRLAHVELREGRQAAAAAVSRLARSLAPDEPEPQRLLSVTSAWLRGPASRAERPVEVHCALGDAFALLGDTDLAEREFHAALALDDTLVRAHLGLARLRLPGVGYATWLQRLHEELRPGVYLEIGVEKGRTIALARPPTIAIGVDPEPSLVVAASATTHLCAETSDAFFASGGVSSLVGERRVDFAFIDGLHAFDQALRDFANVEACSTPTSVVVLHDTVPLDEPTQRRARETPFWTGDTWKAVLCLREQRPDLEVFTIATPPSGLTMVFGLDPGSQVLRQGLDDAVARYMDLPFSRIAGSMDIDLNIVANDWDEVVARLRARGIVKA